jgi:uncharacterized C2H2 Zn-finger protein
MSVSYREELLENTDNTHQEDETGKYVRECPWCGKQFKSKDFLKAVNREGVHRSQKHIQEQGKIPKPENGRKKKTNIVNEWMDKLEKQNQDNNASISGLKTVFEIARINYMNQEKI